MAITQECCEKYWTGPGGNTPQGTNFPPIPKTIQIRRTRHAGHCWRSRDELISDVLLWNPTFGRAKAGRPPLTYIQQRSEDTGYSPEDLPEAMNDREKLRERVWDIHASCTTWWWWQWLWWYHSNYNSMMKMPWTREENIFIYLFGNKIIQNYASRI